MTISQVLFSDCGKRAPVIACPDDVRKNLPSGQRTMPVEVPYPRVGYNTAALGSCPKPYFNCTSNHKSGSTFYAGNTVVTWACVDNQGLAVSCAFGIRLIYSGEASTHFFGGVAFWELCHRPVRLVLFFFSFSSSQIKLGGDPPSTINPDLTSIPTTSTSRVPQHCSKKQPCTRSSEWDHKEKA